MKKTLFILCIFTVGIHAAQDKISFEQSYSLIVGSKRTHIDEVRAVQSNPMPSTDVVKRYNRNGEKKDYQISFRVRLGQLAMFKKVQNTVKKGGLLNQYLRFINSAVEILNDIDEKLEYSSFGQVYQDNLDDLMEYNRRYQGLILFKNAYESCCGTMGIANPAVKAPVEGRPVKKLKTGC
jgi:poly(A) polymerase Pap1